VKILSARRKIPFYGAFDGSLKIDVASEMFVIINFPAAVTWKFKTLSGHVQHNMVK